MKIFFGFLIYALGLIFMGCTENKAGATGVGNPSPITATLVMGLTQDIYSSQRLSAPSTQPSALPNRPQSLVDVEGINYEVAKAAVHLSQIRVEASDDFDCEDPCAEGWVKYEGSWVVDLMSREVTPNFPQLSLYEASYDRIDIRIDDATTTGLVSENISFELILSFNDQGQEIKLRVPMKFNVDIEFQNENGIDLSTQSGFELLFDPAVWLNGVSLSACLDNGDFTEIEPSYYEVDEGDCEGISDVIKENIKNSGKLF